MFFNTCVNNDFGSGDKYFKRKKSLMGIYRFLKLFEEVAFLMDMLIAPLKMSPVLVTPMRYCYNELNFCGGFVVVVDDDGIVSRYALKQKREKQHTLPP